MAATPAARHRLPAGQHQRVHTGEALRVQRVGPRPAQRPQVPGPAPAGPTRRRPFLRTVWQGL